MLLNSNWDICYCMYTDNLSHFGLGDFTEVLTEDSVCPFWHISPKLATTALDNLRNNTTKDCAWAIPQ